MNQLIPLHSQTINGNAVETVSARELHSFVESKRQFADWIKNRIEKYGFVENVDYLLHKIVEQTPSGAKHKIEYYITLDMAKQLAMVENNEKGMQVRKYFIECEKKLKETATAQPVQPIGKTEDKLRTIILALDHSSISPVAKETAIITSAETLTGVSIGYRPQIEQRTYSAKELGDVLGISANKVGRIANAHELKTDEYGMLYLSKAEHSDKQVETWRYYDCVIDKMKTILENE